MFLAVQYIMNTGPEIVSGQRKGWSLLRKLGEGDAGEVYLVEALFDQKVAILKRPQRSAFSTDVHRQAAQIKREGQILLALDGHALQTPYYQVHTPRLLDWSKPEDSFGGGQFIILEKASGFPLSLLARLARFGSLDEAALSETPAPLEKAFLTRVAETGRLPRLLALRAAAGLLDLLESIHTKRVSAEGVDATGLLWNDVKPEHLFWCPEQASLTVIDWGNGQFLTADGVSEDRRFSRTDDIAQFSQEMGRFILEIDPELHTLLEWPGGFHLPSSYLESISELKERMSERLEVESERLRLLRQRQDGIVLAGLPRQEQVRELELIQSGIMREGELPDRAGLEKMYALTASALAEAGDIAAFSELCLSAMQVSCDQQECWQVLAEIAGIHSAQQAPPSEAIGRALQAALTNDWPATLWELLAELPEGAAPGWLDALFTTLRRLALDIPETAITPYTAAARLAHVLEAAVQRVHGRGGNGQNASQTQNEPAAQAEALRALVGEWRTQVLGNWKSPEPDPPHSALPYSDLDRLASQIEEAAPQAQADLFAALDGARWTIAQIMESWAAREFSQARGNLRQALLRDPDRRRVFQADRLVALTPGWLAELRSGPERSEPLSEFATRLELRGRELRSQVGPAPWLNLLLDGLRQLRRGSRLADILMDYPGLRAELPWIDEFEPRQSPAARQGLPLSLERLPETAPVPLSGRREGSLGQQGEMALVDALDVWVPEAAGSSARVFSGLLKDENNVQREAAVKIMRPDRLEYALPLFREETAVLSTLQGVPGVIAMLECGFIRLDASTPLPSENETFDVQHLDGQVRRFGIDQVHHFLMELDAQANQGWLPYLACERLNHSDNLMALCDAAYTHGRFLTVPETLRFAIQILDTVQAAHARSIIYRDHKILHFYWNEAQNSIQTIDWNIALRRPNGVTKSERQFDLVQFAARGLHHILTGRAAPGALPLGPNRPEEIEQAATAYTVHWTYDDQRLPKAVKDIVENALAANYTQASALRDDLAACFAALTDQILPAPEK